MNNRLRNIHESKEKKDSEKATNVDELANQLRGQAKKTGMSKKALEKELTKMSKTRRPRSRSRSLSPTSKALARAQLKEKDSGDENNQKSDEEHIEPGSKHWKKKVDEEKLKQAR